MKTKRFGLGDILSVTGEKLVSPRHVDGIYDVMGFITGAPTNYRSQSGSAKARWLRPEDDG